MSSQRAHFFGQLARLTGSGIPILQAGAILEQHARHDAEARLIQSLRVGLERGESIATSLRPSLTEVEYGMVSAAESGGHLAKGFSHLERYYAAVEEARRRIRKALIYPLVLLHAAAACSAVPEVMQGRSGLPMMLMSVGVLWLVLAALYFGIMGLCRLAATNRAADNFLHRIPLAGRAWRSFALARWSAVLHFHLISARNMSTALDAAGAACGSATLQAASSHLATTALHGGSVAMDMPRFRVFPSLFCAGFATAEASGTLDEETAQQMERCLEDGAEAVTDFAGWFPRIIYFCALIYGVWQVYQIVTNIAGMYERAANGDF